MNLRRYFFTLLVALPLLCGSLSAQEVDKDGEFYLGFSGSAVFRRSGFKAGPGFTAAFGYAFKEGFSTEIEWGYQKAGIGNRIENSSRNIPPLTFSGPDGQVSQPDATIITPVIGLDGEIKTQSLMGNFYYRYPKWRVSPYAGFGLGAFFHDGNIIVTYENECGLPASFGVCSVFGGAAILSQSHTRIPVLPIRSWEVSRFGSTSAWSSGLAIAFAQIGGRRSMLTLLRRASDSGFDFSVAFSGCDEWYPCLV